MRAVIQRVRQAQVEVDKKITGSINQGLLIYLGIDGNDDDSDMDWLVKKIANLRIFSDSPNNKEGKINLSVQDINGQCLVISQFTLHASTKKGNRPSFIKAAEPIMAKKYYESFIQKLSPFLNHKIESGIFAADMQVKSTNDGPITIFIDSKNRE